MQARASRARQSKWRLLLLSLQVVQALLVDFGYVQQTRNALGHLVQYFVQALIALLQALVALLVFYSQAAVALLVFQSHQLHALRECFMPLGQPLQSLVNGHSLSSARVIPRPVGPAL